MSSPVPGSYLLATFEAGGCVGPVLTVTRKLLARGHRVRVMSEACNRREVESCGARFVPWTRAPSKPERGRKFEIVEDWKLQSAFDGFCLMLDKILVGRAADYAGDIIEELQREPANLVVANDMLFGVQLGCEAIGQPFVCMACNVMPFPIVPGLPPLGPGLPPAVTEADRALHEQIGAMTARTLDERLDTLNAVRARFALPALARLVDQPLAARRFLLAISPAFDFAPERIPDFLEYVGPQLDDSGWAAPWHSPFAPDDTRPLVLVAFSTTFQDHAGIVQRVVDALSGLPVRGVLTLGGALHEDEVRPADNVAVVHSAPHHALMREAALVITHGGHGTVAKALMHDCPLLVIPHGRDQCDNAIRVCHRGAGLSLEPNASVAQLSDTTARLLDEHGFAAAARALGAALRADMNRLSVERSLEALAASAALTDRPDCALAS